jgi:hypothetical protein
MRPVRKLMISRGVIAAASWLAVLTLFSASAAASARAPARPAWTGIAETDSTAPAALDGVVTDSLRIPVAGVEIFSADRKFKATTNSVGAFHLGGIPASPATFTVRKIGFGAGEFTLKMEAGVTRYQTIVLTRLNNVLTPVVVEETQTHRGLRDVGFYERAANARATFLTPEILATRSSTRSSDYLRGVNGVIVTSSSRGGLPLGTGGYMAISDRNVGSLPGGYCVMNVYIDGERAEIGTAADRGSGGAGEKVLLEDLISPADIGAIEIYPSGVSTPQQYTGVSRGCGTILIWSKMKLNLPRDGSRN